MNLLEIIKTIHIDGAVAIAVLLLSCIQIAPIKVNPWSWIARKIGGAINAEVMEKQAEQQKSIDGIRKEIDDMRKCNGRKRADDTRNRILRFDDELRRDIPHSKEFWEQTIEDCDFYDQYCLDHPKYRNGKATSAVSNIRTTYDDVKKEDKFI